MNPLTILCLFTLLYAANAYESPYEDEINNDEDNIWNLNPIISQSSIWKQLSEIYGSSRYSPNPYYSNPIETAVAAESNGNSAAEDYEDSLLGRKLKPRKKPVVKPTRKPTGTQNSGSRKRTTKAPAVTERGVVREVLDRIDPNVILAPAADAGTEIIREILFPTQNPGAPPVQESEVPGAPPVQESEVPLSPSVEEDSEDNLLSLSSQWKVANRARYVPTVHKFHELSHLLYPGRKEAVDK